MIRQLLTESFVLAAAGGALGALVALWGVAALVAASPLEIPRLNAVTVDRGVLLFTTAVSMVTGVLFLVIGLVTGKPAERTVSESMPR